MWLFYVLMSVWNLHSVCQHSTIVPQCQYYSHYLQEEVQIMQLLVTHILMCQENTVLESVYESGQTVLILSVLESDLVMYCNSYTVGGQCVCVCEKCIVSNRLFI